MSEKLCDKCGLPMTGNEASWENHRAACERVPTPDVLHRLNHAGMSLRCIASIYGTTYHFVTKQLRDAGLKKRDGRRQKWQKRLTELPDWAPRPVDYQEPNPDETQCPNCEMLHTEPECPACAAEAQRRAAREAHERKMAAWRREQARKKYERGALQRCGVRRNYA